MEIAEQIGVTRDAFYALPQVEQDDWIARWEMNLEVCRFCKNPRTECENPQHEWYPQRHIDYAEMAAAAANWLYDKAHEDAPYHDGSFSNWSKTRSTVVPFHFRDGVRIWVSRQDLTPGDMFLSATTYGSNDPDGASEGEDQA